MVILSVFHDFWIISSWGLTYVLAYIYMGGYNGSERNIVISDVTISMICSVLLDDFFGVCPVYIGDDHSP